MISPMLLLLCPGELNLAVDISLPISCPVVQPTCLGTSVKPVAGRQVEHGSRSYCQDEIYGLCLPPCSDLARPRPTTHATKPLLNVN